MTKYLSASILVKLTTVLNEQVRCAHAILEEPYLISAVHSSREIPGLFQTSATISTARSSRYKYGFSRTS